MCSCPRKPSFVRPARKPVAIRAALLDDPVIAWLQRSFLLKLTRQRGFCTLSGKAAALRELPGARVIVALADEDQPGGVADDRRHARPVEGSRVSRDGGNVLVAHRTGRHSSKRKTAPSRFRWACRRKRCRSFSLPASQLASLIRLGGKRGVAPSLGNPHRGGEARWRRKRRQGATVRRAARRIGWSFSFRPFRAFAFICSPDRTGTLHP